MSVLFSAEFWKSIPIIIQFFLELKKFWDSKIEEGQRREKLKQFKEAIAAARATGDTHKLELLVDSFRSGS